jgi:hypothetical protein
MKLTTTTVRTAKLPPGKTDHIEWDDDVPGFGLRIREGGSRRFCFQYTLGTKDRRMTLGVATPETVARARKIAGGARFTTARLRFPPNGPRISGRTRCH